MLRFTNLKCLLARSGPLFPALLALFLVFPQSLAAEDLRFGQGLLWKVQKADGPASHILGTIHSTDPRLQELPPAVAEAFDAARVAVFELPAASDGQAKMAQAMRLPAGERLENLLGSDLFGRVAGAVEPLGVKPEGLQGLKPWALVLFLGLPPIEIVRQAQGKPAFDFWLRTRAAQQGKRIEALESYDEQIELFDGLSTDEQIAMVTDLVSDYDRIEQHFNRMFRAYLKGDISQILAEANDVSDVPDAEAAQRFKVRLLDDRNVTMVQDMARLLDEGGAFIAIGAAHLPGEGGVLDLLEDQGYRVTRAY
jgi:uncharacterized protein YbaP (TraB family)